MDSFTKYLFFKEYLPIYMEKKPNMDDGIQNIIPNEQKIIDNGVEISYKFIYIYYCSIICFCKEKKTLFLINAFVTNGIMKMEIPSGDNNILDTLKTIKISELGNTYNKVYIQIKKAIESETKGKFIIVEIPTNVIDKHLLKFDFNNNYRYISWFYMYKYVICKDDIELNNSIKYCIVTIKNFLT